MIFRTRRLRSIKTTFVRPSRRDCSMLRRHERFQFREHFNSVGTGNPAFLSRNSVYFGRVQNRFEARYRVCEKPRATRSRSSIIGEGEEQRWPYISLPRIFISTLLQAMRYCCCWNEGMTRLVDLTLVNVGTEGTPSIHTQLQITIFESRQTKQR